MACSAWLAAPAAMADPALIEKGRAVSIDKKKGNCLACHMIPGGAAPGNIAPALVAMKARFPEKEVLYDNLWDQTKYHPHAMMPPFGKHGILTEDEIRAIVEYLYTL